MFPLKAPFALVVSAYGSLAFHFVEPGDDIGKRLVELAGLVEGGTRFGILPLPQVGVPVHKGLEREGLAGYTP